MRSINSIRNMLFGFLSQITSSVLAFITRTVFIYVLGVEYLGVQGLFTNILSMLSLANLGFGSAIIYSLYKPLKEKNCVEIKAYMNLYKNFYIFVAAIVLIIGLIITPFLPRIINMKLGINENLFIIYIMFLLESSFSYLCIYKQSILIANQQNYIISKIHTYFVLISNLIQIFMLIVFKAYMPVLIMQLICRLIENIIISKKADKEFGFLKDKSLGGNLPKNKKKQLFKNVYSMLLYKISGTVINSTDNIVISYFIGVVYVGIYSNYLLIVSTIKNFVGYIFSSMTASVGNLIVSNEKNKKQVVFNQIFFLSFWIYGMCSIILYIVLNEFIELWLGKKFLLDNFTVLIIIVNFYTTGMQSAATMYRETTGMFIIGKYRPIIAAILNILISVILAPRLKIAGVLLGTIISRLCVYFWFDPVIIYKNVFNKSCKEYFLKYILYTIVTIISGLITIKIYSVLTWNNGYLFFIIKSIICLISINTVFLSIFFRTDEFKSLFNYLMIIIKKLD